MESNFWHARWSEGRTAFHEGKPNEYLVKHLAVLGPNRTVLVPLCGKTEDLSFLASQGHHVVGIEWVESAVQAFFEEHNVAPTVEKAGPFTAYSAGTIRLFAGDFFASTREILGSINALYDRAALIALPPPLRKTYVTHLRELLPSGSPGLVVTADYDEALMSGPPFSVPELELRGHYKGLTVNQVAESRAEGGRLGEVGAKEQCFAVRF